MTASDAWDEFDQAWTRSGLSTDALSGRTAIVTGGGRGIGRWTAVALARAGARVVIAELSAEGEETAAFIRQKGGQALAVHTDVSQEESVSRLIEQVHTQFGPVNILVNNAILCPAVSVQEMPLDLWDRVLAVNLRGTFLTCRACLPDLLAGGRGVIVNLVSTDAMPGLSAYIASKQGITGFTQSLAAEVGQRGVRVVAFGPGMVDTPGIRGAAVNLVRYLGMTEEQFIGLSLHPAYAGLMPAAHAGLAAAYLIANLADEFHGEVVTGYTVLERAGVIAAPGLGPAAASEAPSTAGPADLAALVGALGEMLTATEAEFNRLPVFVRPMARSGFKGRSGQSLPDWQRSAGHLAALLAQGDLPAFRAACAPIQPLLPKLIDYFAGVPEETARFTRDQAMLQKVARISQERIAALHRLIAALE